MDNPMNLNFSLPINLKQLQAKVRRQFAHDLQFNKKVSGVLPDDAKKLKTGLNDGKIKKSTLVDRLFQFNG